MKAFKIEQLEISKKFSPKASWRRPKLGSKYYQY